MRVMTLARAVEMVSKPSKVSKVECETRRSLLSRRELTGSSCGMGLTGGSYAEDRNTVFDPLLML